MPARARGPQRRAQRSWRARPAKPCQSGALQPAHSVHALQCRHAAACAAAEGAARRAGLPGPRTDRGRHLEHDIQAAAHLRRRHLAQVQRHRLRAAAPRVAPERTGPAERTRCASTASAAKLPLALQPRVPGAGSQGCTALREQCGRGGHVSQARSGALAGARVRGAAAARARARAPGSQSRRPRRA
jgi:hypothetical protein